MKKVWIAVLLAALLTLSPLALTGCGDSDTIVLNVYNWGEYISTGEEGSYDTNAEFENWYFETYGQKVRVNYSTYDSNESLRSQLELGTANYDVIVPSDYMIQYFIEKDLLAELNFDNIPAYENISETYRNLYYDPENKYTVPYTYGVVGIIYDANEVDPADVTGWEVMWNSKYSGEILQFRNSRDAFGTAMYMLDIDVNTADKAAWDRAKEKLLEQKPLRKMLVMDEVFNMMEMGEAAVAAYYAGDYFTMRDNQAENVDLRFFTPDRTNVFVDAMCVLKTSKHKDVAEAYINFMLMEDAAVANSLTHWYASPNTAVLRLFRPPRKRLRISRPRKLSFPSGPTHCPRSIRGWPHPAHGSRHPGQKRPSPAVRCGNHPYSR